MDHDYDPMAEEETRAEPDPNAERWETETLRQWAVQSSIDAFSKLGHIGMTPTKDILERAYALEEYVRKGQEKKTDG